jgi:hypothetical protein
MKLSLTRDAGSAVEGNRALEMIPPSPPLGGTTAGHTQPEPLDPVEIGIWAQVLADHPQRRARVTQSIARDSWLPGWQSPGLAPSGNSVTQRGYHYRGQPGLLHDKPSLVARQNRIPGAL